MSAPADETEAQVSAVNVGPDPSAPGALVVSVIAKRTFDLVPGMLEVARNQVPLVEELTTMRSDPGLPRDPDIVMCRGHCDVVIEGHAYAPEGAMEFEAGVTMGDLRRKARFFGDRRCTLASNGRIVVSKPERCELVPLAWAYAYGGVDRGSLADQGDPSAAIMAKLGLSYSPEHGMFGYPRNRIGRGYLVSRSRRAIDECLLPNFHAREDVLNDDTLVVEGPRAWPSARLPIAFGWMPLNFFPRSCWMGLPAPTWDAARLDHGAFIEVRSGTIDPSMLGPTRLRNEFSTRASQSAAPGMQALEISPGAVIELENLHPREARFRSRLPGATPRMVLRLPGGEPIDLDPRIRTVHIEPDEDRLALVWVGEHRLSSGAMLDAVKRAEHAVIW